MTFTTDGNGTLDGTTVFTVYRDTPWSDITVPALVPGEHYENGAWDKTFPQTVTEDITFTALFFEIYVSDFELQSTVQDTVARILINECEGVTVITAGATAQIKKSDGTAVADDELVGTGMIIEIRNEADEVIAEHIVVIPDDVDGDGCVSSNDLTLTMTAAVDSNALSEAQRLAADVSNDGVVDTLDALLLQFKVR